MKKTRTRTTDPSKVTLKNFRRLEVVHRLKKFQDTQGFIRQLRDAQMNADALEGYLAKMHYNARSEMPDRRHALKAMVEQTFRGRGVTGQNVVDAFPARYDRLREVLR
jgi:hypothetical protein